MIKSLLGLAITLSTLILPGICAGAVASPAPAVIVESSQSLMLALKNADIQTIVLNGSVRLQRSAWKEGEIVIASGRRVTLTRRDDQAVVMLDMHNIVDAIHVSAGATLELVNITLSNPASAVSLRTTNHTRYVVPWLPSWPSITIEPNATVVKTSTLTYTWSSSGDASDSFRADVANVLGPYGVKQDITYPNYRQEMMHLSGSHSLTQPVVDRVANATVGYMLSEETDTRTLCVPLPSDYLVGGDDPNAGLGGNAGPLSTQAAQALGAPGQSAGSKRTEKWVIAVSVVGSVAAAAIALAVMCSHVHYRRKICQVLREKGDKDTGHDCESHAGTSGPVSSSSSLTMAAQASPFVPRSPFEDMRVGLVAASMLRSGPSSSANGQTMNGAPAGYLLAQGSATSTQGGHPGAPQDSYCISEDSAPGSMELALLPAATASTPASPERFPQPSFPWALQQRRASFSAAPSALDRSASGAPQPPRSLTHGRASAPVGPLAASERAVDAADVAELSELACPPSPFLASATPRLSFKPQLSSRQLVKLAKQASLTSRTSLCSVSSLLTRVTSGLGSQPIAARSPFEKGPMVSSPFDRALSSMLKVNSESCLTSQNSSSAGSASQRSLQSIASAPGSGADMNPASKMCFNDSAYAEGDRDEIVKARASHPAGKLKAEAKPSALAAKVFDSMTSLPTSSHKPPAAATPPKAVSRFDSVASMPASQKQSAPLKAAQTRTSRLSPAVSPRAARSSSTQESDFADLKFGPLIGTGSFGRVYKASWKGAVVAVKVIVHNASMARKVDTLRESLVGISMQHQHVMTTYKVMTTMKADQMDEVPDARYSSARRNGYSVAHLGPGNATKQEMLETWLLLEYCDGGPLDQAIKSNSRFKRTMGIILLSLMDIASGMKYLHSLGIVHSDLKGANVLIKSVKATEKDPRGYVCKLADFGLARVLGSNRTHVSTSSHGTVSYQPMEVLHDGRVTRSSDVYSYGMIMLEVFTGVAVFEGFSSSQILYQVFNGVRPAMPDNLPAPYRALIQACWQRDPELRPSFAEVHDKLAAMYNELPACQRPVLAAQR
ncbi:g12574 [Coccomyxa viridis]|uniref:G12574 protein n=1 Tax=Coccomyxa viridis TaxID=1274662 RepID=A0ABP1GAN3_9CHLO